MLPPPSPPTLPLLLSPPLLLPSSLQSSSPLLTPLLTPSLQPLPPPKLPRLPQLPRLLPLLPGAGEAARANEPGDAEEDASIDAAPRLRTSNSSDGGAEGASAQRTREPGRTATRAGAKESACVSWITWNISGRNLEESDDEEEDEEAE